MELKRKLKRWQEEGLIDQVTAEKIQAFEQQQPAPSKLPLLLIIGLIFFSLAVFSFIAANWQMMPAFAKIGLVLLLMWLFYGFGQLAERKQFSRPHIFRLLGLAMFGASIIVTIQTFHLSLSTSVLGWALFLASLAHHFYWKHVAYAIVAFFFGLQILSTSINFIGWVEWLAFVAAAFAWFYFNRASVVTVFSWLLLFGSGLMLWPLVDYENMLWPIWTLFALVGLLFLATLEKEKLLRPFYLGIGGLQLIIYLAIRGEAELTFIDLNLAESIALLVVAAGIFALCFFRFRPLIWLAALGPIGLLLFDDTAIGLAILAELTGLAYLAVAHRRDEPLALGFVYFILVQFVLYFIYAWERLDMSLFFLVGALLLFALSGIAWWINRKKAGVPT
ncbi:DUF2157 domain-containing protein [Planococcus shixiaomingii]|uniref:DUF2157 domain-containing protein n=1 Tax=Planococcus shixiaomingii TaxID=3058393 RepID=UPI0026035874|nr:DUF2157 domain-containing protein [Planococcus sp. N022]WKA55009.1 DUF2157 domain-containing protein [Planococcus sp. N022]